MCKRLVVLILLNLLLLFAQAEEETAFEEDDKEEEIDGLSTLRQVESERRLGSVKQEGSEPASAIPGKPGFDYPIFKQVPATFFACAGRLVPGYYADTETRCQVFHICGVDGAKHSFLCPEGSVFNQKYLVCDWWHQTACDDTVNIFTDQVELRRLEPEQETGVFIPGDHQNYVFLTNDIFHTAETGVPGRDKISQETDTREYSDSESHPEIQIKDNNTDLSIDKVDYNEFRNDGKNKNCAKRI